MSFRRVPSLMRRNVRPKIGAGGGPAPAWSPLDLPGLVAWYDAGQGITLNGTDVSDWADQSGLGNHLTQTTPLDQPAYITSGFNGGLGDNLPFVRFDGVDHWMICSAFAMGAVNDVTLVMLQDFPTGTTANAIQWEYDDLSNAPRVQNTASNLRAYNRGVATSVQVTTPVGAHMAQYDLHQAGVEIWVDNVSGGSSVGAATVPHGATDILTIGGSTTGTAPEEFDCAHCIVVGGTISAGDRALLWTWAQSVAGL